MHKFILLLISLALSSINTCKKEQTTTLKLLSYNIHHGEGQDKVLDLTRFEKIITSLSPDICGLQEVDKFCTRSNNVDQIEHLAQKTGMTGTFGKFMDYGGGEYGMATLVAKPIISTKVVPLPDGKYEPRTSIVHEIQLAEGCTIAYANVHFEWIEGSEGDANRMSQAKALVKYIDGLNRATIIMGDFNCTPDSPTMRYFKAQGFVFVPKGEDNLSFQGNSKSEIDHVVYRNSATVKFEKKSIQLIEEPNASDHRPLVAELKVVY